MAKCEHCLLSSRIVLVAVCVLAVGVLAHSSGAAERELDESPPPSSTKEIKGPLERIIPRPEEARPSLFPWVRRSIQQLPPFLANTRLELRYRTYYLRKDRAIGTLSEAWAMGGSLYYHSGWLKDVFAVEVEGFTSQPIVAPEDRGGTLLLQPVQEGITVLGVANGKLRYGDFVLTGFRQKLDLPYLNASDDRMIPNTFEAVQLAKVRGELQFVSGYVWKIKRVASEDFVSLSKALGIPRDRGAPYAYFLWDPSEDLHLGAGAGVLLDVLADVYAEVGYNVAWADAVGLRIDGQFTHEHTVGSELLRNSPYDTWNVGVRASTSWRGVVVRLGFSITGEEQGFSEITGFGSSPSYVALMQREFTDADEKALLVSASYDFGADRNSKPPFLGSENRHYDKSPGEICQHLLHHPTFHRGGSQDRLHHSGHLVLTFV